MVGGSSEIGNLQMGDRENLGRPTYRKIDISLNGDECGKRNFDGSNGCSWWMEVVEGEGTCRASRSLISWGKSFLPAVGSWLQKTFWLKVYPYDSSPSPTPPPKSGINFCSFCLRNVSWIYSSPFQQTLLLLAQYFLTLPTGFLSFGLSHLQQNLQTQSSKNGSPMSYKK